MLSNTFCFVHHICTSLVPSLPDLINTHVEKIGETEDEASANLQPQSTELVHNIIPQFTIICIHFVLQIIIIDEINYWILLSFQNDKKFFYCETMHKAQLQGSNPLNSVT